MFFCVDNRAREVCDESPACAACRRLAMKRVRCSSLGCRLDFRAESCSKALLDGFAVGGLPKKFGSGVLREACLFQGAMRLASANTSSAA